MSKRSFVIYDTEEWYGKKLNEYIRAKCREDFEFYLFTKKKPLKDFLTANPADILLAANLKEGETVTEGAKHFIALSEAPVAEADDGAVYKYGSAEDLLRKVMRISAADEAADLTALVTGASVTGFYTPIGRSGQTTLALTMGQMIAKKKKTLYMSFESYSTLCGKGEKEANDLLDLLYFSECTSGNFACRVSSMAARIGELDYIPPARNCLKFRDIGKEKWLRLIKRLRTETDYECILMDLSEQMDGLPEVLSICQRLYSIEESDKSAIAKMSLFDRNMEENGFSEVLQRMTKISIPRFGALPEDPDLLTYSELAEYARRIIEKEDPN